MTGWAASRLEELPQVAPTGPGPAWYPLQHVFGLTAFGANAFVAAAAGDVLVAEHDERASGQEELYAVVAGRARFEVGGEQVEAESVSVVAVRDPSVTRSAVALEPGTMLLVVGGPRRADFRSTWRAEHFARVARLL